MINSKIIDTGKKIEFPEFTETNLYMHFIFLSHPQIPSGLKAFEPIVREMVKLVEVPKEQDGAYLTIDCQEVPMGQTHRRGGVHIDGNYERGWTTGWKLDCIGGGMLIVSSYSACRAWTGSFDSLPNKGGDCNHMQSLLNESDSFMLEPNKVYLTNSTCVHESLPVPEIVKRQLVRITLPALVEYL